MSTPKVEYAYSEMAGGANHSRLVSLTYPDGRVLEYVYSAGLGDAISRLSLLADASGGSPAPAVEEYNYLGLGTVVRRHLPEPGVELTYIKQAGESDGDAGDQYTGLDRFGRIVDQRWRVTSDGSPTDRFGYGYDPDGNRLYRENLIDAAFSELYSYDALNQLTSFQRGELNASKDGIVGTASRSQEWALDALGNWDTLTTDGVAESRTHNRQNQVTAVGGSTLTFDANGNTTTDDGGRTLTYDAWNRLVAVTAGSSTVSFTYDALNRRLTETPSGTTTDLYYSALWQVLEERVGGAATAQYVWSPVYVDALVLRDRDTDSDGSLEERLYAQQDANYNVTALLDAAGNVVERYVYDPYGQVTVLTAGWVDRGVSLFAWVYLHQGGRFEQLSATYHFRHRDLSAAIGRFLQRDPIEYTAADPNLYRFVKSRPTAHVDPLGLKEVTIKAAAFIHKQHGHWIAEPGNVTQDWEFKGDVRDFGEKFEQSRIRSWITFDTAKIGRLQDSDVKKGAKPGVSERRRTHTDYSFWPFFVSKTKVYEEETTEIKHEEKVENNGPPHEWWTLG